MKQYIFYDTDKGMGFVEEDLFEGLNLTITKRVKVILSEQELKVLTSSNWEDVKKKIKDILNSK